MATEQSYLLILLQRSKFLFGVGIVVAIFAVGLSLLFPLKYSATGSVLIIPRQGFGIDPYTVIKSAERTGENLATIVQTSVFLSEVMAIEPQVVTSDFPETERQRRRFWKRMIDPQIHAGTGVLSITAYHEDPQQAQLTAQAVITTLITNGENYVNPQTGFKVVDSPVTSRFPVKPNLIVNAIVGFLFGLILASLRVLFAKESRTRGKKNDHVMFGVHS